MAASGRDLLAYYERKLNDLRADAKNLNLSDDELDRLLQEAFDGVQSPDDAKTVPVSRGSRGATVVVARRWRFPGGRVSATKMCLVVCVLALTFYVLLLYHKPTYNLVVRNIQDLIYPTMKYLRWLSLPFVKTFPSITVWYDEICLIENPYFEASDINCWPCEEVKSILDLSDVSNPLHYLPHSAFPFIVKGAAARVTLKDVEETFAGNRNIFGDVATTIVSNYRKWQSFEDIVEHHLEANPTEHEDTHVAWRLNRLESVRVIRNLFPRPNFVPNTINVERFLLVDEPKSPHYKLPFPEGYRVFIMQASGDRLIILEPVPGCVNNCSRVSVLLHATDFMYYNSWFYQAWSSPVANSSAISITYIGSY